MARAVWSGSISFGLVNVGVKAYTAVRDHAVHFHQLDKKSGSRIGNQKVAKETGRKVDSDDDATRAYRLLAAAMEDTQRVGIGSVVMRNKQYLAAIRPLDGALAMSTMRFADEVVDVADLDDVPTKGAKPAPKELRMAEQLIDSLSSAWRPERYHDTFTEELEKAILAKDKGNDVVMEDEPEDAGAEVIDLMAALEASVKSQKRTTQKRTTRQAPKQPAANKRASRKPSGKSSTKKKSA